MASSKREQLVDTALKLFYRDGFHATGIDRILAESGVAKMTLYNHFKSKDELILAALRLRDERFRNWFMKAVEQRAEKPAQRLLAVFDVLEEWFRTDEFCGCMFINASAEFGRPDDPIHEASAEHKRLVQRFVTSLAEAAGAPDPPRLARQLCLLIEGASVLAHISGDPNVAREAQGAARQLIDASLAGPNARPRPEKKKGASGNRVGRRAGGGGSALDPAGG